MSSITKLQIRGIRSFSPGHEETIEFYSPLTMIVGANGCGKTTIIESLKFVCAGSLPPNSKSGQSMVNDPGMTDSAEVKASIKLLFQNRAGQTCVAVRSLQVTKKKTKLEFKALDGAVKNKDDQGISSSLSMKCSDMDRVIPENLGVSPAIIENVIFVHQEESSWPMQEGNVLKKKFDDIFESTRYTKALEALVKTRKEFAGKAKDLKAELGELKAHFMHATQSKKEIEIIEANQEECNEELATLSDKLESTEKRLRHCREILDSAREQAVEFQRIEWQVNEAQRRVQEKTQSLESRLADSDEELQRTLNNFESVMATRTRELDGLKKAIDGLNSEITTLREENNQLILKKGQAVALQEQSKQSKEEQIQSISTLARKHTFLSNINLSNGWNSSLIQTALGRMSEELSSLQMEGQDEISKVRVVVQSIENACNLNQDDIKRLEFELNQKTEEARGIDIESSRKRAELARLASAKSSIQHAQLEFDDVQRSYDEFSENFNVRTSDYKRQIKETSDRIRDLQEEINNDAQLLQELSLHRNEIASVDASIRQTNSDLTSLTVEIDGLFSAHRDLLQNATSPKALGEFDAILKSSENTSTQANGMRDSTREELSQVRADIAAKEALIRQNESQLIALRSKVDALDAYKRECIQIVHQLNELQNSKVLFEEGISTALPINAPIEEIVSRARALADDARDWKTASKSSKYFLKKFIKTKRKNPGSCPCCRQSMSAAVSDTFDESIQGLFAEDVIRGTPEEIEAAVNTSAQLLDRIQTLQNQMLPLLEQKEALTKCEAVIEQLNSEKKEKATRISQLERVLADAESTSTNASKLVRQMQDLSIRWKTLEQRQKELNDRKRRQSESLLIGDLGGRSLEELEQAQRDRQEKKDQLQVKKEKLQSDENNLTKKMFAMKANLAEKEKSLSDARLEGNRAEEVETAISTLQTKLADIETRKMGILRDKGLIEREFAERNMQLSNKRAELQQKEEFHSGRASSLKAEREHLLGLSGKIETIEKRYAELHLDVAIKRSEDIAASIEKKEKEKQALAPKIASLTSELASQEHTKRNVLGNIELRANIMELEALRQQLRSFEKAHSSDASQVKAAERDQQLAMKDKQTITSTRDVLRGKIEIYRQQSIELEKKLSEPTYKGIDERHRRKNIEFETTNMAVQDLENYHNALDRALQNFHTLKIRGINKIIRELWQSIYQGQDIDTIEIESGSDLADADGFVAPSTGANSRSYNYRVVMKKGDLPLDMRGRCSAGQRVLAAIVIRLALAETFCVNCGILALDEPTTNLDDANKQGLAHALARLILSRSQQQNFQLICITHDEDFVQTLRNELSISNEANLPSYYFRVYRREEGGSGKFFSHIERIPWEDM